MPCLCRRPFPNEDATAANTDIVVSVVAVLEDDAALLPAAIESLHAHLRTRYGYFEILLVDNASADGSSEAVVALQGDLPDIRMLRLSRRQSLETAIAAGLETTLGDYVVVWDIATDPVTCIPDMVDLARSGYGVVVGVCHRREAEGPFRRWAGARRFYAFSVPASSVSASIRTRRTSGC